MLRCAARATLRTGARARGARARDPLPKTVDTQVVLLTAPSVHSARAAKLLLALEMHSFREVGDCEGPLAARGQEDDVRADPSRRIRATPWITTETARRERVSFPSNAQQVSISEGDVSLTSLQLGCELPDDLVSSGSPKPRKTRPCSSDGNFERDQGG